MSLWSLRGAGPSDGASSEIDPRTPSFGGKILPVIPVLDVSSSLVFFQTSACMPAGMDSLLAVPEVISCEFPFGGPLTVFIFWIFTVADPSRTTRLLRLFPAP